MKNLKLDFTIDYMTRENIPVASIREEMKKNKNKNYYLSEIAKYYYRKKYDKDILEVLNLKFEIPKCPITGECVSYKLGGSIIFGVYSSSCSYQQISDHIAKNNKDFQAFVEKMKNERKGSGNPMYGKTPWNLGISVEDERIKKIADLRRGLKASEETRKKQSKSALKRTVHGHTGKKHSEESKQIMREKTIARFKKGLFPQTNSLPHKEVKKLMEEIFGVGNFEEEYDKLRPFVFDFMIPGFLIEVQGDYFHCNPKTRHAIPKNKMQIKNVERDKRKKKFVSSLENFKLVEIWEYDIVNNLEEVKICLQNLKK